MAKVSICVPTYNNVEEVAHLLESIASQTYTDYEVIITDDSTDDNIQELVQKTSREYMAAGRTVDINYEHNIPGLGHIFNWNAAIRKAKGQYIKIMFSDDWFTYPDSLEKYVGLMEAHPEAGFVFSGSMQVSDDSSYEREITEEFITSLTRDYRRIFRGNQAGAPSGTMYRNTSILFDEKSNWASDLELYLHILSDNPHFAYTREPLISIGLHGEQYTHMFTEKDDRIFNDYLFMYEKYHLDQDKACKEFFVDEYIMKFDKGVKMAVRCGNTSQEYWRRRIPYLWEHKVMDYVRAGLHRLGIARG
ncbi:MAG: glycosyltransferase family 2 protein [Lachnospiraceae bacterium]|nr:glycosyltransferase family 2 protein [Lachnospiraceae bacterium]